MHAADFSPFYVQDLNPFVQIHGLPPPQSAELVPPGRTEAGVYLNIANNSVTGSAGLEAIVLDGETYRLSLNMRRGVGRRTELGVTIPYVVHDGGVFDAFVENWHDLFGLSNSRRASRPRNALEISYAVGGSDVVRISDRQAGLGDVVVYGSLGLSGLEKDATRTVSLRTGLKLPTGDAAALLGSKGIDAFLLLAAADDEILSRWRMAVYGRMGVLMLGDGEVLASRVRDAVAFGGLAAEWRGWQRLRLKAQLDAHSRFYDSALDQLGLSAVQLTVGGSLRLGPDLNFDLGVVENLRTDPTPDVIFSLGLRGRF